ncbi:MAG: response regulator [Maribacter sp.]|nr:response regulator [Maribacter sp.]
MTIKIAYKTIKNIFRLFALLLIVQGTYAQTNDTIQKNIDYYFEQAIEYKNRNELGPALETLDKAAEIAEKNEDVKSLVDCYHMFAVLYLKLGEEEKAEFYSDRANVLLRGVEYPYGSAMQKYLEAIRLYKEGKNFLAIYFLEEAKQLNNDRNFFNNISLAEGNIYLNLGKYDGASKNFNSLIINTDPKEKDYLTTRAYLGLAKMNYLIDSLDESIVMGQNALKLAREKEFSDEVLEANEQLGMTYAKLGKYDLAYERSLALLKFRDSLYTSDKALNVANTGNKIHVEQLGDEIKRQDIRLEELGQSANRSELAVILTSAFLMIISLLAVSLYRNNQIKLRTNDLLQTKNRELQYAKDAAVNAMEAKTNFLSTVSHELRTPLYAVTGLTHLLLEENPSENQKEHLKALKFSGDYLLNFINDILQINKIDANKLETLKIEFNLKKVLKEVIDSLQQSAKANNTKIILDYDENIPGHLLSDPLKLSQVFMNLVGNAIKFTKNGEVIVIAKLIKKEEEDVTLYFEVADTGIGISEEQQENIFEGFEQGSIQINREYGGTGLGLTIVKSLLGLFESQIQLKSVLGEGSSFFFELKVKSKEGVVDDIPFEITTRDYDFKGLHILIVEDNKINQVITKKMLSKKEITSDIANTGTEAIEMVKKNKYDAILMDIHMPGISGEEATIEIRKFDKDTPIIALTAISLDDSLEGFYAAGCNDVVTKPFKPEVFYQKIGENIFDKDLRNTAS